MCRLWLPITALLLLAVGAHSQELSPLGYTYCAGIADPDSRTWCLDYVNSNKADVKWRAAVEWSKYRPGHCKRLVQLLWAACMARYMQ